MDTAELRRILLEIQTEVRNGNIAVSRLLDLALAELEKAEMPTPDSCELEWCDHVYVPIRRHSGMDGFSYPEMTGAECAKCGYRPTQSIIET